MKRLHFYLSGLICLCSGILMAQSPVIVDLNQGADSILINRNIYGHFAEHLGHCIYDGFYVGDSNRSIPNTEGVRNDIIEALRTMKIPLLRWPGGCFADTYHWKDGIGDKAKRPSMVNSWWGGVTENNSFGTHDFLNMCERLGASPYLAANVGSGTVQELSQWVQYVNFEGKSPMSDLRKANGRDKPWNVKYWGVGNEAWGCGGNMTPEYYANLFRQYATFMGSRVGNDHIFRIASGANSADFHWTEVLMRDIPADMVEGLALHHYSVIDWNQKGPATDFTRSQYFKTMKMAWKMEDLVSRHAAIMDKYDPSKKIALVVDEWGGWYDVEKGTNPGFLYQQNSMRDALLAAITLNIFNNHADRVRMANLAQTVNVLQAVILTDKEKIILTPTYHVMEMYNVHQDAKLLPVNFKSPYYKEDNDSLPAVSVSASIDKASITHISLANIDPVNSRQIEIRLNQKGFRTVSGRILVSEKIQDYNSFAEPQKVRPSPFHGATLKGKSIFIHLPPASVVVLELN